MYFASWELVGGTSRSTGGSSGGSKCTCLMSRLASVATYYSVYIHHPHNYSWSLELQSNYIHKVTDQNQ